MKSYLPILTYHRLLSGAPDSATDPKRIAVSQAQFRSHLRWLKRLGYQTVRLEDYVKQLSQPLTPTLSRKGRGSLNKVPSPLAGEGVRVRGRCFAITFDDGYEEVLTLALPVLKEFGFTATVFAVAGQLGGCNAWDDGRARLLTAEQYRTLLAAGITIGAHTSSHVHLPDVAPDVARREIQESKKKLEAALGQAAPLFAYPYGEYTPAVESLVRDAGFAAAFATDRAGRDHAADLFSLRRVVIFPRTTVWELLWKVQPWYPAYQDWKRR